MNDKYLGAALFIGFCFGVLFFSFISMLKQYFC
jgi:hypothetical protein